MAGFSHMTGTYDPQNIFARILRDEIPCKVFFESRHSLAFYDISPAAPMHLLVIPRGAYRNIYEFTQQASAEEILDFWQSVNIVAEKAGLTSAGFRLIANTGPDSGQEVPHFHVHLLGGAALGPLLPRT